MHRRAWRMMPKAGNIDNLKLIQESLDNPAPSEVQIEVKAIGFNFADIFAMYGLYGATPPGSFVPGLEYSGIVSFVGSEVKGFKKGQKIMGITRFGGYASHLNIDQRYVVPLPEDWSFEEGAAYLVQALTAYYALIELGNLQKGMTVLVQSAAGGVGIWANRIAKNFNAYTIGCVGNESKLDVLKKEGYDKGFVRGKDFRKKLHETLDGKELNIVLESVGGRDLLDSYLEMASEGRLVTYGSARFAQPGSKPNFLKMAWLYYKRPKLDPQKMIEQNKAVMGFNLIYLYEKAEKLRTILDGLSKLDLGKPLVGHVFEFQELKKGIQLFQTGKTTGKVVVTV